VRVKKRKTHLLPILLGKRTRNIILNHPIKHDRRRDMRTHATINLGQDGQVPGDRVPNVQAPIRGGLVGDGEQVVDLGLAGAGG
jgi:hypothetical protein